MLDALRNMDDRTILPLGNFGGGQLPPSINGYEKRGTRQFMCQDATAQVGRGQK